jgi:hypothetical protein
VKAAHDRAARRPVEEVGGEVEVGEEELEYAMDAALLRDDRGLGLAVQPAPVAEKLVGVGEWPDDDGTTLRGDRGDGVWISLIRLASIPKMT